MKRLKDYVDKIVDLSPSSWAGFSAIAKPRLLSKNEYLVRREKRYDREVFICSGVVRGFFIDENGNEKNVAFYQGPAFMSTNTLRSKNGLSVYAYQALVEVEVLEFNTGQFLKILNEHPEFFKLVHYVKEQEIDRLNKREVCLLETSAEAKYKRFLESYPDIEKLIPHYNVASYLGITPVTLSRLKHD